MNEEWKTILGYGGYYLISNTGKVCSIKRGYTKMKKPHKNSDGYLKVRIGCGKLSKVEFVHRLVAEAFIGDISNKEVNHLDGNKENNNVSNLEICSHRENMQHAFNVLHVNNRGMKGRFGKMHHLSKPIYQLDKNNNLIKKYDSLMDAARELNLCVANISKAALGKAHTCGGFKWSYKL